MKFFPIKKTLILVTLLAVPGFLYYLLKENGKNRYRPLPFYGPKVLSGTFHTFHGDKIPDTLYHQVADFHLLNQQNTPISFDSYKGKILILSLFYTKGNNYGVNFANKAIKNFENTYGNNSVLRYVGLSIDPTHDTPEVLAAYARQLGAKAGKWDLLTGDSTAMFNLINKQLYVDALQKKEKGETSFVYSNLFVLLDTKHRIRGYYEATSQEDLGKLDDEIKVLILEELRNNTDGR